MFLLGYYTSFTWRGPKYKFDGSIGYADSYLKLFNCHFKVFRLHAFLHDAARAVRAHCGKGLGYSYMSCRISRLCLLGHMTTLLFRLYVKLLLPAIFKFVVNFWSSMSYMVPDIETADKKVLRKLGDFINGIFQGFSFSPPNKYKPKKQTFCCVRNSHKLL